MILLDTSIWIELLNGGLGESAGDEDLLHWVTCGPVLQELLQGTLPDARRQALLAMPVLSDPLPKCVFLDAAEIYGQARRHGFTIRSSVDCLIAAIAIANGVSLCHRDRDFDHIARFTPLRVVTGPWARA